MGDPHRPLTTDEKRIVDRLRRMTARYPGTSIERDGFGHSTLRAGKKPFVIVGAGEDGKTHIAIKSDLVTQDALIRRGPWFRTPYIGQHGWVSAHTSSKLNWAEIEDLVDDAYRTVAPKRMLRELDDVS